MDFAIWSHNYEDKLLKKFLGNKIVNVYSTLGLVKEAFVLRLLSQDFSFDIFLIYKLNETHQWNGYQGNRQLFRCDNFFLLVFFH